MKIALGTTSKNKVRLIKEVFAALQIELELEPQEISSGVSDQPMTSAETQLGSTNRAVGVLSSSSNCALGVEVGYHPDKRGDYCFLCWATIVDTNGVKISKCSEELLLPTFHQQALKSGKYLIEYAKEVDRDAASLIADYRDRVIKSAVKTVVETYLKAEKF